MYNSAMLAFLSEPNLRVHEEYMRKLRLRHSIMEKSLPEIKGKSAAEVLRMPMKRSLKNEILPTLMAYEAHKIYFSSFSDKEVRSDPIRKAYGSESAFCYEMLESARRRGYGFLYVFKDARGKVSFRVAPDADEFMVRENPLLVVDLFEHAYFSDYGYAYEKYLRGALSHLDFSRLGT